MMAYKNRNFEIVNCDSEFLKNSGENNINKILGKTDKNFPWGEYTSIYQSQEVDAMKNFFYYSIVPFKNNKGEFILHLDKKIPWRNEDNVIIGVICNAFSISNKNMSLKLINNLINFQNSLVTTNSCCSEKITAREAQCLYLTLMGNSARKIADLLNISIKTVEGYIYNIKNKFSCYSKSALIEKIITIIISNYL